MNLLKNRYLISFAVLAVLVMVGLLSTSYLIDEQEADSLVINIAGRQRMLSQKISKVSLEIEDSVAPSFISELESAVELFDKSHDALRFGDEEIGIVSNYSEEINLMYERLDPMHSLIVSSARSMLEDYRDGVRDFSDDIDAILGQENDFLVLMNEIVFAHEDLADSRLSVTRWSVYLISFVLLIFIIFEWLFLIRPTIKRNEQVDKAKSEFVSLASHQLRTPLTSINWFCQMLIDGDAGQLNKEQNEFLEQVLASSERMVELVNDLLNVSRIDLQTFSITPTEVDIKALARSVADEMKPTIDNKKLKFNFVVDPGIGILQADKKLMRMVMQNLLSNAVKYTPDGGEVGFLVDYSSGMLRLRISDTGVGIPLKQQKKIFSKLFRADNVQKIEAEGTGLGLYIVKSVVDNSGGKISFQSKENVGTVFTVLFPPDGMARRAGKKALT